MSVALLFSIAFVDALFLNAELGWNDLKHAKEHFQIEADTPLASLNNYSKL